MLSLRRVRTARPVLRASLRVGRPASQPLRSVSTAALSPLASLSLSAILRPTAAATATALPGVASRWSALAEVGSLALRIAASNALERLRLRWWILMAAPKRKTSKMRQRMRRFGQWAHATKFGRKQYRPYGTCTGCGNPVRTAHICIVCRKAQPKI